MHVSTSTGRSQPSTPSHQSAGVNELNEKLQDVKPDLSLVSEGCSSETTLQRVSSTTSLLLSQCDAILCVCVCVQETYGKLLAVEKYQDRLRAKGLFSSDVKTM